MLSCHRLANSSNHLLYIQIPELPLDFVNNHQPLFTQHINRKRYTTTRPQGWMALFYRQFDILGILVVSSNEDQVFDATSHEQLTILQKSQVAGAQKRPLSGSSQVRPDRLLRLLSLLPVTLRDARTGDPDLAYFVRWTWDARFWINDHDFQTRRCMATAHKRLRLFGLRSMVRSGHDDLVLGQCRCLQRAHGRQCCFSRAGDKQHSLGKPIAGSKGLQAETTGG